MKFFKDKIKYASRVLSPTAALWVMTYAIPNAFAEAFAPENMTYPEDYNQAGHAMIAMWVTGIGFVISNVISAHCNQDEDHNFEYCGVSDSSDESRDEENPTVFQVMGIINDEEIYV